MYGKDDYSIKYNNFVKKLEINQMFSPCTSDTFVCSFHTGSYGRLQQQTDTRDEEVSRERSSHMDTARYQIKSAERDKYHIKSTKLNNYHI